MSDAGSGNSVVRTEIEDEGVEEWYLFSYSVSLDGHTKALVLYNPEDSDSRRDANRLANQIADLLVTP